MVIKFRRGRHPYRTTLHGRKRNRSTLFGPSGKASGLSYLKHIGGDVGSEQPIAKHTGSCPSYSFLISIIRMLQIPTDQTVLQGKTNRLCCICVRRSRLGSQSGMKGLNADSK